VLPVTMRAAPTITLYNPLAANAQIRDIVAVADFTASAAAQQTEWSFSVQGTGNAATAVGNTLLVHATADASL